LNWNEIKKIKKKKDNPSEGYIFKTWENEQNKSNRRNKKKKKLKTKN